MVAGPKAFRLPMLVVGQEPRLLSTSLSAAYLESGLLGNDAVASTPLPSLAAIYARPGRVPDLDPGSEVGVLVGVRVPYIPAPLPLVTLRHLRAIKRLPQALRDGPALRAAARSVAFTELASSPITGSAVRPPVAGSMPRSTVGSVPGPALGFAIGLAARFA